MQLGLSASYITSHQSVFVKLWDKSIFCQSSFAMSTTMESTTTPNHHPSDNRKQSPPAFLDLADSVRLRVLSTPTHSMLIPAVARLRDSPVSSAILCVHLS